MKSLVLFALLLALCGAGFAPPSEWEPKQYPISFWCGPPDEFITPERYREVAEAGFNYLMPPCEGSATPQVNHRILDTAKATGLKAFLQDERMPLAISGSADAKSRLDAIVREYAAHPSFAGYFLTDEPGEAAFDGLAEVVAYLRAKDPKHPAVINLFPSYASPEQLGVPTYTRYVADFQRTVHPFAISYDHYHFLKDGDRPTFFTNLDVVRSISLKAGVPFWQIVLSIPHGSYRPLTEAEKRWEAFQTLAYGGKGLFYFTYWQPGDKSFDWGPPIILRNGTRTPQYEEMKRINADVQSVGKYLIDAVPSMVFQTGNRAPGGDARPDGAPVHVNGPGDVTVGLFRRDTHLYALLTNRDYKKPITTEALLSTAGKTAEMLDRKSGKWIAVKAGNTPDGDKKVDVSLAAGDGELYRW